MPPVDRSKPYDEAPESGARALEGVLDGPDDERKSR